MAFTLNLRFGFWYLVLEYEANYYRSRKQNTKQDFPSIILKPVSSAVGSDGPCLFTAHTRKNVLFAHSTSPLPRIFASQDTGRHQTWRAYAPLSLESSPPGLRAVGGLCLEISLVAWGPDPVLYQLFAIQNRRSFPIRKK